MRALHKPSSCTKYIFVDRDDSRSLRFFLNGEGTSDDSAGCPIFRVFLVPLKGLLHSWLTQDSANGFLLLLDPSIPHLNSIPRRRSIADNTASAGCFDQARSWIATCLRHHRDCGATSSRALYQYYPTRLLDLQPRRTDIEIRLCVTHQDPPETPYMTLSHCWGTSRCLKLNRANLRYLVAGFQLTKLPKCFREAIQITRELGIRYLWIDALCILQDSQEDWQYESALMTKVYENSYCNIAALDASDNEQGCFFQRDPSLVSRTIIETNWDNELKTSYDVCPEIFWRQYVTLSRLNRRAWVVQERALAPRVLCYGQQQLFWECLEMDACETYPDGIPFSNPRRWKDLYLHTEIRRMVALEPETKQMLYNYWRETLRVYTGCGLTKAEDKLVAISGLAKKVQSYLGDEYLAGLWKESLPSDLLWFACYDSGREPPPKRSSFYRAPTWSWACVDGIIRYEDEGGLTFDGPKVMGVVPGSPQSPPSRDKKAVEWSSPMITILAAGVDLATSNVTGQVTHGFIRLSGTLIAARMELSPDFLANHDEDPRYVIYLGALLREDFYIFEDFDLVTKCDGTQLFFLPIMVNQEAHLQGLLLELVDPINHMYERLGLVKFYDYYVENDDGSRPPWETKFEEQVLTLI